MVPQVLCPRTRRGTSSFFASSKFLVRIWIDYGPHSRRAPSKYSVNGVAKRTAVTRLLRFLELFFTVVLDGMRCPRLKLHADADSQTCPAKGDGRTPETSPGPGALALGDLPNHGTDLAYSSLFSGSKTYPGRRYPPAIRAMTGRRALDARSRCYLEVTETLFG